MRPTLKTCKASKLQTHLCTQSTSTHTHWTYICRCQVMQWAGFWKMSLICFSEPGLYEQLVPSAVLLSYCWWCVCFSYFTPTEQNQGKKSFSQRKAIIKINKLQNFLLVKPALRSIKWDIAKVKIQADAETFNPTVVRFYSNYHLQIVINAKTPLTAWLWSAWFTVRRNG